MKQVALAKLKDDLSRYLRLAENEEIVITRHGKAAGVIIGFGSDDDWFDFRLERDPRFLDRIAAARASLRAGRGVRIEEVGAPRSPTRRKTARAVKPGRSAKRPRGG